MTDDAQRPPLRCHRLSLITHDTSKSPVPLQLTNDMKQPRAIIAYVAITRNCLRDYDERLLARVRGERDKLTQTAGDLTQWAQARLS